MAGAASRLGPANRGSEGIAPLFPREQRPLRQCPTPIAPAFLPPERQASVMRITIDEQARLVHVLKGAATLTLALPYARTREALETTAWALELALTNASVVIVNGEPISLRENGPRPAARR